MSIKHLDYCREFLLDTSKVIKEMTDSNSFVKMIGHSVSELKYNLLIDYLIQGRELAKSSVKYILPVKGLVLKDAVFSNLRGKKLELPYPTIALEFTDPIPENETETKIFKTIIFAIDRGDKIELYRVIGFKLPNAYGGTTTWAPSHRITLNKENVLTITNEGKALFDYSKIHIINPIMKQDVHSFKGEDSLINIFLDFLNSLAHPGIRIFKSNANVPTVKSKSGKKKKVKTSIPYDDYHVVTIDVPPITYVKDNKGTVTERCSPRQHTRAAHWRRYKSGKRVRIEEMVINADNKSKVEKVYKLRNREGGININTR